MRKQEGKRKVFKKIKEEEFISGRYYRIYMKSKLLGYKRLLGFGKFDRLPDYRIDKEGRKRRIGGRTFLPEPQPKHSYKGWTPTWKIVKTIEDEVNAMAEENGVEARSSIIPMRRWFHPKYKVYADKPINLNRRVKAVAISVLIYFEYPHDKWIQKSTIVVDLNDHPMTFAQMHNMEEDLLQRIGFELQLKHPALEDFNPLSINGFIPLEYEKPQYEED